MTPLAVGAHVVWGNSEEAGLCSGADRILGAPVLENEDFCPEQRRLDKPVVSCNHCTEQRERGSLIFCRVLSDLISYPSLDEIFKYSCFV